MIEKGSRHARSTKAVCTMRKGGEQEIQMWDGTSKNLTFFLKDSILNNLEGLHTHPLFPQLLRSGRYRTCSRSVHMREKGNILWLHAVRKICSTKVWMAYVKPSLTRGDASYISMVCPIGDKEHWPPLTRVEHLIWQDQTDCMDILLCISHNSISLFHMNSGKISYIAELLMPRCSN